MGRHDSKPAFKHLSLIIIGGLTIMAMTAYGIMGVSTEMIQDDVTYGPMKAALWILLPIFATVGGIYYLASIKQCKHCGKVFFWRKKKDPEPQQEVQEEPQ